MSVLLDSSPTEDSCRVVIGGRVCLNFSSAVVIFGFCKHSLELDGKVAGSVLSRKGQASLFVNGTNLTIVFAFFLNTLYVY